MVESFRRLRTWVPEDDGGGVKLEPWPWQRLARVWGTRQVVMLKAWRLGVSWMAAASALCGRR